MAKATIRLEKSGGDSNGKVWIHLPFRPELIEQMKRFGNARWSKESQAWYIPASEFSLDAFFLSFKSLAFIDYSALKHPGQRGKAGEAVVRSKPLIPHPMLAGNAQALERFRDWMSHKRYSNASIKTYVEALRGFLAFLGERDLTGVRNEDVVFYMNRHVIARGLSFSYQNQVVSALKLFYKEIIRSSLEIDRLERPRRAYKLPNVLSKEEVQAILGALSNPKHRIMLILIYSCGLRRGELINLRPQDIDSSRNLLIVRMAKGRKDRVVPLSPRLIEMLRAYYRGLSRKPRVWLFEGQRPGEKYSEQSLANVLKKAVVLSGIKKPVTLHWLRHSYATHLLENGTDLRYIQELLGHKSSRTTEIYTHVSQRQLQKIRSPFDDLDV